ncbi:phage tail protein [Apilactobacillus timberlakei]|uniref:phage tail sheath C-terminal domain-containing protein n=1 Tax=Apilactobacillus timberlakei TaxID=2008380 RepID=UPI00112C55B8|nr:phage tail sheath C-terminal domain-containing protein [Apilactobacillus timberlakei]TPR21448.1 phage tail protein [Apilactobacillus timberlakei]
MAGGIFTLHNKVRPGAYINTKSAKPIAKDDSRGTVLLMNGVQYGWGNNGIVELTSDSDFKSLLGVKSNDSSLLTVNEALKGATQVLLVNANDGNHAQYSDDSLPWKINAKYAGIKGNDITIDLIQDAVDNTKIIIKILFDFEVVDTQTISMNEPQYIQDNDYVSFTLDNSKTDKLKDFVGQNTVKLTGGTTNPVNDLSKQMNLLSDAMQKHHFTVATTAGFDENSNIHSLLVEMVKDLRDKQGLKVTAVVPYNTTKYDYEAVSVVENGVILQDDTIITSTVAAAYFAGKSSSVPLNQSLTYADYDNAKQSYPALGNEEIIRSLKNGHIVFTDRQQGGVVIEQDINSLVNFTDEKSYQFHKNRELRALDEIANNTKMVFERDYIGKSTNNAGGRNVFKGDRVEYFKQLIGNNVIDNYGDLDVSKGEEDDQVIINYSITPVDSMEKLYNTITVTR